MLTDLAAAAFLESWFLFQEFLYNEFLTLVCQTLNVYFLHFREVTFFPLVIYGFIFVEEGIREFVCFKSKPWLILTVLIALCVLLKGFFFSIIIGCPEKSEW